MTSDARKTTDDGIRIVLTGEAVGIGGAGALLTIDVKPKIPRPYELAYSSEHFGNWSKIHCKFRHVDQEVDLRFEWDRRTEKYTINDKSFDFVPGDEISVVLLEDGSVQ